MDHVCHSKDDQSHPINSMIIARNVTELVHDVVTLDDATTVKDHDEV